MQFEKETKLKRGWKLEPEKFNEEKVLILVYFSQLMEFSFPIQSRNYQCYI